MLQELLILFLVVMFTARVWTKVKELTADSVGKRVLVRARLHTTRGTGRYLVCVIKAIHSKQSFYIIFLKFQMIQHFLVFFKGSSALWFYVIVSTLFKEFVLLMMLSVKEWLNLQQGKISNQSSLIMNAKSTVRCWKSIQHHYEECNCVTCTCTLYWLYIRIRTFYQILVMSLHTTKWYM